MPEHKAGSAYVDVSKMTVNYIHSLDHSAPQDVHLDGVADFSAQFAIDKHNEKEFTPINNPAFESNSQPYYRVIFVYYFIAFFC